MGEECSAEQYPCIWCLEDSVQYSSLLPKSENKRHKIHFCDGEKQTLSELCMCQLRLVATFSLACVDTTGTVVRDGTTLNWKQGTSKHKVLL